MKPVPPLTLAVVVALLAAAPSQAAPPDNDNYLASSTINAPNGLIVSPFTRTVDTSEATTQADTFNPNRDGVPFGGGKPEPTSCPAAPAFGKTVWYDFVLPSPGGVRITTTGFDNVVAIYEWNLQTSQLGRRVACQNASTGPSEELLLQSELRARRNYTVQVGGVNGAAGMLGFSFEYFRDRDGDGIFDEAPDKCLRLGGIEAFGGCPPLVRGSVRLFVAPVGGGVRVTRLTVDRADRGTRIELRCRRCGRRARARAPRGGSVRIRGFDGRIVSAGDRIQVRIARPEGGSGRFRFGAIGKVVTYPITGAGLGASKLTCTRPGSSRKIRCP